ncbi:MAG: 16S rRNA (uracil(1498)-N(3))-methyltransferase [Xanthomonadaceae bacterium]|nr:16S rRNA (uracil(1498)-N(3))-methyltransferase [Xanthomonadaceae bacterium]
MRLTRVYIDAPLGIGLQAELPEHAGAHLVRVLRLREGDACILFNGDGHDYDARIIGIGKRGVQAEIVAARRIDNESPLSITLLQGIARGEKMDLILQKTTELGVARIIPVHSERSEVKLEGARAIKRLAHWRGVVASACEQSGRTVLPQVDEPLPLLQAVANAGLPAARYLLSPLADSGIDSMTAPPDDRLLIAVGPEGGWSDRDLQTLDNAGFTGIRLGPRILRTETAGLAAIAALQMRLGDLG